MQNLFNKSYANEFLLVARLHIAEYFAKPILNIGFVVSLAIATSTLLSILVLNDASKQQYQQANNQLKSPIAFNILPLEGATISIEDYSRLRKLGFHQLNATHVFRKTLSNGKSISFRAIDILPLVLTQPESFDSNAANISSKYAATLFEQTKLEQPEFEQSENTLILADKTVRAVNVHQYNDWGNVALIDITLAWQWFPEIKGFSHLTVSAMSDAEVARLQQVLPDYLSIQEAWALEEREGFAQALHLNLSALAILGFIVSLFIAYQAANQAWRKRSELAIQMRLLGVNLNTIQQVMWCESLLLTLVASFLGSIIAMGLVSVLLPILGLTLEQLYHLRVSGHFQWHWQYALWAFLLSALAVILALVNQFRRIASAHVALSGRIYSTPFGYKKSLIVGVILFIVFALWPNESWHQLMLKYGLFLLASVAMLPNLLTYAIKGLSVFFRSFKMAFLFKDARQQIGRRFLPLAAFYLALTSSISAALMVNSFESSFVAYLNQLLSADVFISYKSEQKHKVATWLHQQAEVKEVMLFEKTIAKYKGSTIDVYAIASKTQQQSLLLKEQLTPALSNDLSSYEHSCYINEQLAYKDKVLLGQTITINQGTRKMLCQVVAIYYDYGNQGFALKITNKSADTLSGWQETGFGVVFETGLSISAQTIAEKLALNNTQIFEPDQIKQLALSVFKQTFVLTQAIAFVLLAIACFGLFLSANGLELARKAELHILSSLGYARGELFKHMLLQWLLLAFLTVLISWPVACVLADALVTLILPASFGWSMPLVIDILPFASSSVIGLLILIPALTIPLYNLKLRTSLS